jgi:16S rRNA G966 N2-methylase RsmD
MEDRLQLLTMTAERAVKELKAERDRFDLVFCDPPWQLGVADEVRDGLHWVVAEDAVVVVEHASESACPELRSITPVRTRRYGGTSITYYEVSKEETNS